MSRPNLYLVDDHALFRAGLGSLMAREGFVVCGEASTGAEALAQAPDLEPDLVVLDFDLPDTTGLALARSLRESLPNTLFACLSGMPPGQIRTQDHDACFTTVLSKGLTPEQILSALLEALPATVRERLEEPSDDGVNALARRFPELTHRELEILLWLGQGKTNEEIGRILDIRHATVKVHVRNVFTKLHLENRQQAMLLVLEGSAHPSTP